MRLTGIVGQRASRKSALDGYRLWLRDSTDLVVVAGPRPTSSPSATPGPAVRPIAAVLRLAKGSVRVEAVVTIPATLLDASGRRLIVQDASGAIELLLPVGQAAPRPGMRLQVDGEIGTAYGAPRIRVDALRVLGAAAVPEPRSLPREPGSADEGQLVRITGRVVDLQRLGDRWRAEVRTGGGTVVVAGLAGAAIPAATMAEGTRVTVTGVVRRPHPAATDRRFAVVPRGPDDVRVSDAAAGAPSRGGAVPSGPAAAAGGPAGLTVDADLAPLPGLAGVRVRVGGIVVVLDGDRVSLDDGTATGRLQLTGDAADLLPLLETGDAVSAVGVVAVTEDEALVLVDDPAGLVRLGDLGEALPLDPGAPWSAATDPATRPAAALPAPADPAGSQAAAMTGAGATPGDGPLMAGVGLALLASSGWATLVAVRRRRDRRRLTARIAGRIAALTAPPNRETAAVPGPARTPSEVTSSAEHGPTVREPA